MNQVTRRWYVVHTHPHAELRAAEHLRRQGFEVYVPRFLKLRSHARKIERVARPLFPRYFFVALDIAAERWQTVRSTIGITNLISGARGPIPVADRILTDLRSHEDKAGFFQYQARPHFVRGEKIKIANGTLSICSGLFEGMVDDDRVTILLDFLGRQVRVILDCERVSRA